MTKRTAWQLENLDPKELDVGKKAVRALIEHAKRIGGVDMYCPVSDEDGNEWLVTVTLQPKSKTVN